MLVATPDSRDRGRVQIARETHRDIRGHLLSLACHRSPENLAQEFWRIPFEPYAPIRRQLLNLLRLMNQQRQSAGFEKLSPKLLRYKRQIVQPFLTKDDHFYEPDCQRGWQNPAPVLAAGTIAECPSGSADVGGQKMRFDGASNLRGIR